MYQLNATETQQFLPGKPKTIIHSIRSSLNFINQIFQFLYCHFVYKWPNCIMSCDKGVWFQCQSLKLFLHIIQLHTHSPQGKIMHCCGPFKHYTLNNLYYCQPTLNEQGQLCIMLLRFQQMSMYMK